MSADLEYVGRVVDGRYRLEEILGRGGFGAVYRAWDIQMDRAVAVKLLPAPAQDTKESRELRARFAREARSAGRINHPSVVSIFDFDNLPDGSAYLAMELMEGLPLSRHLARNGPLPPAVAKDLFLPVIRALGKGHDLGIVHKDLKPGNLFLIHPNTPDVSLRLTDFGVARVLHEERLTITGLLVGTPQYLSPEYIEKAVVTAACDVYQMALVMIEAIVGLPALPAGEPLLTTCRRHFEADYQVPDGMFDSAFGQVLRRALKTNPDERYQNCNELAEALEPVDMSTVTLGHTETLQFIRAEDDPHSRSLMPPTSLVELGRPGLRETNDSMADTVAGEMDGIEKLRSSSELPTMLPADRLPSEHPAVVSNAEPDPVPPAALPMRTPVVRTPTIVSSLPPAEPIPESTNAVNIKLILLGIGLISLVSCVGGAALILAVRDKGVSQPERLMKPAQKVQVAPVEVVVSPESDPEPEEEIAPTPAMVRVDSEPGGATIIINGEDVGVTPFEVEGAPGTVAELRLEGYETAVVEVAEGIELVTLKPKPTPQPKPKPKPQPKINTSPKPKPAEREAAPLKFTPKPKRWDTE